MENTSYTNFLDFFEKHSSDFNGAKIEEAYNQLKNMVEDGTFELKEVLTGALERRDFKQITVIIESIRREYFLERNDPNLYQLLLRTAIECVKEQTDSIESELMWNVKQVLDIDFHQSQLVDNDPNNAELYFQLCFEVLDPRFKNLLKTDKFALYEGCIYFVMFASGTFKNNKDQVKLLQPRIQLIIDNDYGPDHHFSRDWIELFKSL